MHRLPTPCPRLVAEIDGPVARLLIDNPTRRNAIDIAMWRAFPVLLATIAGQSDARVVILSSREGNFSAGADISEFATERATAEGSRAYERENVRAFEAVSACPLPVLAAIRGFCFGAGAGLAMACDLRIASEDASFAIPAARLGVARTKELFFTGRRVEAAEALSLGMLNRVVPGDRLAAEAEALATAIARGAPMTHTATKRAVDAAAGLPSALPEAEVQALADACFESADYVEGRLAFSEKRDPSFTGR